MKTENEIQVVKFIDLHHLVCKYFKKFDALAERWHATVSLTVHFGDSCLNRYHSWAVGGWRLTNKMHLRRHRLVQYHTANPSFFFLLCFWRSPELRLITRTAKGGITRPHSFLFWFLAIVTHCVVLLKWCRRPFPHLQITSTPKKSPCSGSESGRCSWDGLWKKVTILARVKINFARRRQPVPISIY